MRNIDDPPTLESRPVCAFLTLWTPIPINLYFYSLDQRRVGEKNHQ